MPTTWTKARAAGLVVTGMALLLAGVVAGSAVGRLIAPEPDVTPLLLGQSNNARAQSTRVSASGTRDAFVMRHRGNGGAIRAESVGGDGAITLTDDPNSSALDARQRADERGAGSAVTASGGANTGIQAFSADSVAIWAAAPEIAIFASGSTVIDGDLSVSGTCTGCTLAVVAVNDSDRDIVAGDAVTVTGVRQDAAGLMLLVASASTGDIVVGVADGSVEIVSQAVGAEGEVIYSTTLEEPTAPGSLVRVITHGVRFANADVSGGPIAVGDSLAVGGAPGALATAPGNILAGRSLGYALGSIEDGKVAVLISPH